MHCQLPIVDCRLEQIILQIGNWQSEIGNYLVTFIYTPFPVFCRHAKHEP
jgi:hypothetical protein